MNPKCARKPEQKKKWFPFGLNKIMCYMVELIFFFNLPTSCCNTKKSDKLDICSIARKCVAHLVQMLRRSV